MYCGICPNEKSKTKSRIIGAIFLLVIGVLIYCLFDPDVYISKILINLDIKTQNKAIELTRNYLPDILWTISYTLMVSVLSDNKYLIFLLPALTGIILEIFQKLKIINGTFDVFDILVEIAFAFITMILLKRKKENEK